jgi:protein ImuA
MQAGRRFLTLGREGPRLALGRAHEIAGPARRVMAAMAAAATAGPVIWARGDRVAGGLFPDGLSALVDPARIVTVRAPHGVEALWAAEEALRSGAAPLVVVEPREPPGLTPVRRLNLAAEAGGGPLCLILTAEGGSAAAVETRWWARPLPGWATVDAPGGGPARWRFELLRDKAGPPGAWEAVALRRGLSPRPRPVFARAA